jgi:hypothetical protein
MGGIDHDASFVRLHLEPAPLLDNGSSVRVEFNGRPVTAVGVASLRAQPALDVLIPPLPPGEAFIRLSIQPDLYVSQNVCHDLASGNLYMTLGPESAFHVVPRLSGGGIAEFFRPFYDQVTLHVPAAMNPQQLETAYGLLSALAYQFRTRQTRIIWQQGDESPQGDGPRVVLEARHEGPEILRQGSHLRVQATREAVQALSVALDTSAADYQPALLTDALSIETITPPAATAATSRSFRDLGFQGRRLTGIGTHEFRLPFTLAQLGGRPQSLSVLLRAAFTPVDGAHGERLTAQVYLNSILLETFDLNGQTSLRQTVALPTRLLRRNNALQILFVYTPIGGHCNRGPSAFTVQMYDDSGLNWTGDQGPSDDLDDLPHVFLTPGQLIVDTQQPISLAGAASLLGTISRLGGRAIMPEVVTAQAVEDWATLPKNRAHQSPPWRLVALPPGRISFPAPVRLGESFEIYNPVDQRRLFKGRPADPVGFLQYFVHQGVPTLWLSWWGAGEALALGLAQTLADPASALGHQLGGNVVTYSRWRDSARPESTRTAAGGQESGVVWPRIRMWSVGGGGLKVAYPEASHWQEAVRRYWSLLIVLAVLIGGFLAWRLYARLGRPPSASSTPRPRPAEGGTS